jgi:hypothetical protein
MAIGARVSLRGVGVAVATVAALALFSGTASAQCGNYVHIAVEQSGNSPVPRQPCHGPNCSQKPAAPSSPAPVSPAPSQVKECVADVGSTTDRGPSHWSLPTSIALALPQFDDSIFHPPRG